MENEVANIGWIIPGIKSRGDTVESFHFDQDEMMRAIIDNNNKELHTARRAFKALQPVTLITFET